MADYTSWPLLADVQLKIDSAGVTLRAAATTAYKQSVLDAVTAEVERRCRRTFVAANAARTFDGSGAPELDVDEYVSLTAVRLLNDAGSVTYTFAATQWHEVAEPPGTPRTRVQLTRGAAVGSGGVALAAFPVGRRNVEVTALWGYGSTIPQDLWDAVAGEAAARLAGEAIFTPTGRTAYTDDAGVRRAYDFGTPGKFAARPEDRHATVSIGWRSDYERAIRRYRRPASARLRRVRPGMI